jgi:hypothetical protein
LSKRLSDIQKKEIIQRFINGESLDLLSERFGYTKLTISRNIKKSIGLDLFNNLNKKSSNKDDLSENLSNDLVLPVKENNFLDSNSNKDSINQSFSENQFLQSSSFMELVPIDLDIDNSTRKDCSSIPIEEIDFPEIVYMIVDKKIELEIKLLKDYPEWHFLPEEDLQIKTIEIYFDLKVAKRDCKKDQKVIKVPNTNVFKIASKIMVSRGIKRIISDKQLISL